MPALKNEDDSPSYRYYAPHVVAYVKSYQGTKGKINVLSGIDDLYQWYQGHTRDINKESSVELREVVEEIRKNAASELDVVKNVFYWVQDNIRYIAFEQGMRGHVPHSGSYVCEKRYGDCKDMANIIVNMLELAGIKSYHTWIGTRDIPYTYTEFPTPIVDNHMIATYISKDNQYYYLDATSNYTPFGYPSSMIQGKEALIAKSPTQYELKVVPELSRDLNEMTDSVFVKLSGHDMIGNGSCFMGGYPKIFAGYQLDLGSEQEIKQNVTKLIGKGNNKFYLDSYHVSNLLDRSLPTGVEYTFRLADYYQDTGDEIYVNLNLTKDFYNKYINTATRKTPKEFEYNYVKEEYIEMEIPQGYAVEFVPESTNHEGEYFGYDITYQVKGNKIAYYKKIYHNYLLLQSSQFESWNNSIKSLSDAYRETIILKKI
jgi:hypothetical protein